MFSLTVEVMQSHVWRLRITCGWETVRTNLAEEAAETRLSWIGTMEKAARNGGLENNSLKKVTKFGIKDFFHFLTTCVCAEDLRFDSFGLSGVCQ